jgi:hypothetical protein
MKLPQLARSLWRTAAACALSQSPSGSLVKKADDVANFKIVELPATVFWVIIQNSLDLDDIVAFHGA